MSLTPVLKKGQLILGRWERNKYHIIKHIGKGGNGSVYLVKDNKGALLAMKISTDLVGLTCEYRMLVFLKNCQGSGDISVVPQVYEIDDFHINRIVYHYIVMQYCIGRNLAKFQGRPSAADAVIIGYRIAGFLSCLHQAGFIFGDLKPDNIIYDFKNKSLYVVDYGSVCVKGQALKQYTPGYDRANWQAGLRVADEKYDIFALGMVLAALTLGKAYTSETHELDRLFSRITNGVGNIPLQTIILKALRQEFVTCAEISFSLAEAQLNVSCDHREVGLFVNAVGITSLMSFILSVFYYYK